MVNYKRLIFVLITFICFVCLSKNVYAKKDINIKFEGSYYEEAGMMFVGSDSEVSFFASMEDGIERAVITFTNSDTGEEEAEAEFSYSAVQSISETLSLDGYINPGSDMNMEIEVESTSGEVLTCGKRIAYDNSEPRIVGVSSEGGLDMLNGEQYSFEDKVVIYIEAADSGAGVEAVKYYLAGEGIGEEKKECSVSDKGDGTSRGVIEINGSFKGSLFYEAVDRLGNSTGYMSTAAFEVGSASKRDKDKEKNTDENSDENTDEENTDRDNSVTQNSVTENSATENSGKEILNEDASDEQNTEKEFKDDGNGIDEKATEKKSKADKSADEKKKQKNDNNSDGKTVNDGKQVQKSPQHMVSKSFEAKKRKRKKLIEKLSYTGSKFYYDDVNLIVPDEYNSFTDEIVIDEENCAGLKSNKVTVYENGLCRQITEDEDYYIECVKGEDTYHYSYHIFRDTFKNNSVYTVSVASVDKADFYNDSSVTLPLNFGIDTESPIITDGNIYSHMSINADSYDALVYVRDNMGIENVSLYIDGKEAPYELTNDRLSFRLGEKTGHIKVNIIVKDKAGNTVSAEYRNIVVEDNPVLFYLLKHMSILLLFLLCAIVLNIIISKMMHKKATDD